MSSLGGPKEEVLVKIRFETKEEKIAALRVKTNLKDTGYRGVFLRSSLNHTDRLVMHNFQTILQELPTGHNLRVTAHGKVVKKDDPLMVAWSRGPPVHQTLV